MGYAMHLKYFHSINRNLYSTSYRARTEALNSVK